MENMSRSLQVLVLGSDLKSEMNPIETEYWYKKEVRRRESGNFLGCHRSDAVSLCVEEGESQIGKKKKQVRVWDLGVEWKSP